MPGNATIYIIDQKLLRYCSKYVLLFCIVGLYPPENPSFLTFPLELLTYYQLHTANPLDPVVESIESIENWPSRVD